jgi:acetyl-CoA carboxylase biotin carboxyl carrier protein
MPPKKKVAHEKMSGLPGLDLGEIERVLAFMCQHNLEQFEFSLGDLHIALKRGSAGPGHALPLLPSGMPAVAAASGESVEPATAPTKSAPAAPVAPADEHIIKSPIVGTFYASPSPDAPVFVKIGDHVSKGQVVCIVEAMKLMNEIESDVAGTVARFLVENNQPVEYGQPLFAIRTTKGKS